MHLASRRLVSLVCATFLTFAMFAAGASAMSLSKSAQPTVLYGMATPVELHASNPASAPYGYNLSFRDILPAGVHLAANWVSFRDMTKSFCMAIAAAVVALFLGLRWWRLGMPGKPKKKVAPVAEAAVDSEPGA